MGKIIITIILINIEITIIQTIIFELENLFSAFLSQKKNTLFYFLFIFKLTNSIMLILWLFDAKIEIAIKIRIIAQH
jgi:hypothetical protein